MLSLHHTSSAIIANHEELINGMEALYQTLIDMGYIYNTDVQVAPHGLPKEPIAVAPLRSAGMDPETIELIGRLPWFTNDIIELQRRMCDSRDGIAIAPSSYAASYLIGSGPHDAARSVGVGAVGEEVLPPSAFKIALTSSSEGYNIAYDSSDKTIIRWRTDAWDKCQRIPVAEFFDQWLRQLKDLAWLPWRDDVGWEIEQIQRKDHLEQLQDTDSALYKEVRTRLDHERMEAEKAGKRPETIENLLEHYLQIQVTAHNRTLAKRLTYEASGWPDHFDKDTFHQKQKAWNAEALQLGASASSKSEATESYGEEHEKLRDFYRSTAGEHAI